MGLFKKNKTSIQEDSPKTLNQGLEKTKESVVKKLSRAIIGKTKVDDEVLDNLEEVLISSDVGVDTTLKIISNIENRVSEEKYMNTSELNRILKDEISALLEKDSDKFDEAFFSGTLKANPYVFMIMGVNGVGKTTTIAKLAHKFKQNGKKVLLGAADTFRAAAIEQLESWANLIEVDLIKQKMGSDPASVAYDTIASAKAHDYDVVIIDTAGRLHNKANLMNELAKTKRVMQKIMPDAPHEIVLVLDASTGQNAFEQAKQFIESTEVNSIALTKLDGTAKGGVVIGVSHHFNIPVKYIGIGEGIDDLRLFNPSAFVESLFQAEINNAIND